MKNDNIEAHFDQIAHDYDAYKSPINIYYKILKQAIKGHIVPGYETLLDIGCGTGNMLFFINPAKGVGVDISRQMIEVARLKSKHNKKFKFYVHDIEKKPVTGDFDYILFNDVIEHLTNPVAAIKNISLTMKKKTTLILSMANHMWEPMLMFLEKFGLKMPEGPHQRLPEKELFQIIKKYGLTIASKSNYLPKLKIPYIKELALIYVYRIQK